MYYKKVGFCPVCKQENRKRVNKNGCITCRRRARWNKCIEYAGGKCFVCGTTENLTFHHKNPKEKTATIRELILCRWNTRLLPELNKCVLLCRNCHDVEHGFRQIKTMRKDASEILCTATAYV